MKRLLALFPLLAFCLFCTPAAFADASVSYLDAQGMAQTCDIYTTLTDGTTAWTDGWYLAEDAVTIDKKVTVTGDVHLILADGASLTTGNIEVSGSNSLTLYAQSTGSAQGSLTAKSNNLAAAIGGGSSTDTKTSGTITINGGVITATGKSYGAAIGGGSNGFSGGAGTVVINGGIVNATSPGYGAAIGDGDSRNIGTVRINGGTVDATCTSYGAAISGNTVTIQGGTITAQSNGSNDIYGSLSTGSNGSAVIYANVISDTSAQNSWSCLWVKQDAATVYGAITLTEDLPLDCPLTVTPNGKLTVNGTLTCQSGLINNGTLTNNGTMLVAGAGLENRGTLVVSKNATLHVNGTANDPCTLTNNGTLTVDGSLELDDTTLQNNNGTLKGKGLCVLTDKSEIIDGTTALQVEYRIFLDGNGATLTDTMLVTLGKKPIGLPTPTREKYRFDGWFTQAEGGTQVTAETQLTASQTLYAHWTPTFTPAPTFTATPVPTAKPTATPNPTAVPTAVPTTTPKPTPLEMHTLHFNTMGGLPLADAKFGLGAPVELWPYTPSRAGYLFMGWYADEALTQPVDTIVLVQDTSIYAKWVVDPAAAAASQNSSGTGNSGSGSGGTGSSAKATPTPAPTVTPEPSPTATPTPPPTATPDPTQIPESTEEDSQGGLPILPMAGGVAALAVIGGVVFYLRRHSRHNGHYRRR